MAKQVDSTNLGYIWTKLKAYFWGKNETSPISIDATPTASSTNLVESGGVYDAIDAKYTKPAGGIPASDLASGVIPSYTTETWTIGFTDGTSTTKDIVLG